MRSPFLDFENATLVFEVPGGTPTINAVGNLVSSTTSVTLRALLNPTRPTSAEQVEINNYAGADGQATMMAGYLIDPSDLPLSLATPCEGTAKILIASSNIVQGKFKLLPIIQSPYIIGLKISQLTKIRGFFKQ